MELFYIIKDTTLIFKNKEMSDFCSKISRPNESDEGDAADFLLSNSKYHDCFLVIGNPESDEVDIVGTVSIHLIAHSPVFRDIFENRTRAPPESKIHITDVSTESFMLMLRYVYGGKLPAMSVVEAAGLALCANKFKIPRLVQKALKRLKPTSVEDVFPALVCVTSVKSPDLELEVEKIIQEETERFVQNYNFLDLDEDCILFILKQNTLNVSEAELWKHVVRWAEHQVEVNPARSVRDCLSELLRHVRFLTFTSEEILEHVLPTKILTSEEFVNLTLAVTKKQPLQSSTLCEIKEKRRHKVKGMFTKSSVDKTDNEAIEPILKEVSIQQLKSENTKFAKSYVFKPSDVYEMEICDSYKQYSTLSIKSSEFVEIESFTCRSVRCSPQNTKHSKWYKFICNITLTKAKNGVLLGEEVIRFENTALYNENILLPIKLKCGKPLMLNPDETWTFMLEFNSSHPVHKLKYVEESGGRKVWWNKIGSPLIKGNVTFKYEDLFHVVEIAYKTL